MNISHDPIMQIAMTPRKQSPEMAMLEWSDEVEGHIKKILYVAGIGAALSIVAVLLNMV